MICVEIDITKDKHNRFIVSLYGKILLAVKKQ